WCWPRARANKHPRRRGPNSGRQQGTPAMISESGRDTSLAEILEILHERFDNGDKSALLYAIYHCLLMKRSLPEWLRLAFLHTYEAHARFEIRSWDEVFG